MIPLFRYKGWKRRCHTLWLSTPPQRCRPVFFDSRLASYAGVPVFNPGPINVSSKAHRYAISTLMSHLCNTGSSNQYLAKYHLEAQKCVDNKSILELVVASYIVAVWSNIDSPSITTAISLISQFCSSVLFLIRAPNGDVDLNWIEMLLQSLLISLRQTHLETILFNHPEKPERLADSFKQRQQLIDKSLAILPSKDEILRLPRSMTTEVMLHKVRTLSIHLHFQLEHFLFQAIVDVQQTAQICTSLKTVVGRIIDLIPRLTGISDYIFHAYSNTGSMTADDFIWSERLSWDKKIIVRGLNSKVRERDTALAILYAFSQLLRNMLDNKADPSTDAEICDSAIAVCRLCDSFTSPHSRMATFLIKRTLFWARMALTKLKFSEGTIFMID